MLKQKSKSGSFSPIKSEMDFQHFFSHNKGRILFPAKLSEIEAIVKKVDK